MQQKSELRKYVRQCFRQTDEAQRNAWSAQIRRQLLVMPRFMQARHVMLYYALPDEPNLLPILKLHYDIPKTFWFPKITGEHTFVPLPYTPELGFTTDTTPTPYHIKEPLADSPIIQPDFDIILTPGMAFDRSGHRLGRGKGFYDRFLKTTCRSYKVGICFPYQLLDNLPVTPHDVPMDSILIPPVFPAALITQ